MEENKDLFLDAQDGIEETTATTEIEDMPDFGEEETTTEESAEETETETTDEKAVGSTEKSAETKEKKEEKKEVKKPAPFKSNLPTGLSFNPLVMAIKPFYDNLLADDEIFAGVVKERESREKKPKSLAECADYIMSEAYNYAKEHRNGNFGMAGFPDEDMYRLIRHYYDEEFLEVHKINNAKAVVSSVSTPKPPAKAKDKPKPVKNVVDITKAIVTATKPAEDGKKPKREKKKDNLLAGFVPMERPNLETYEKDGKKGSREQAKSVEQMDLFADFFAD